MVSGSENRRALLCLHCSLMQDLLPKALTGSLLALFSSVNISDRSGGAVAALCCSEGSAAAVLRTEGAAAALAAVDCCLVCICQYMLPCFPCTGCLIELRII